MQHMKYLLIPIDNIPSEYLEAVVAAVSKFKDERGLRVVVTPKVVTLLVTDFGTGH